MYNQCFVSEYQKNKLDHESQHTNIHQIYILYQMIEVYSMQHEYFRGLYVEIFTRNVCMMGGEACTLPWSINWSRLSGTVCLHLRVSTSKKGPIGFPHTLIPAAWREKFSGIPAQIRHGLDTWMSNVNVLHQINILYKMAEVHHAAWIFLCSLCSNFHQKCV
jgi:hypothetical protein